jgi:hypothetical protein
MPLVKSSLPDLSKHLGLVQSGLVTTIAAHIPGDDGAPVLTVLSNITAGKTGKIGKTGLMIDADLDFPGLGRGVRKPRKYGEFRDGAVPGVRVHLCGSTCKGGESYSAKVHLGQWAYRAADEATSPEAVALMPPGLIELVRALDTPGFETPVRAGPPDRAGGRDGASTLRAADIFSPPPTTSAALLQWAQEHGVPELAPILARQGVRSPSDLARVTDADVDSLFAVENVGIGDRGRFRNALALLHVTPTAPERREGMRLAPEVDPAPGAFGGGPLHELTASASSLLQALGEGGGRSARLARRRSR